MDFTFTARETEWRDRVRAFIESEVRPREAEYHAQQEEGERWKILPLIEELKDKAKAAGLWNLFMPPDEGHSHVDDSFVFEGPGLSNVEYALCAEEMGRIEWACGSACKKDPVSGVIGV
jgi:alkylation response protein AidB-like acyl-CoA dehydrogenase